MKVIIGETEQDYPVRLEDAATINKYKGYLQNQILNGAKVTTFVDLYDRLTTEQRQEAGIQEVPTTRSKDDAYSGMGG